MQEAGRRVHGTTLEQPLVLFALEKPLMRRLPSVAPDLGAWHRVTLHRDCHVQFDRSYYSAPYVLASKALWLRATDTVVVLYEDYRHVCTHLRARRPGQRMTQRDHLPPQAQDFFARDKHWCLTRAADVGPHCTELIARLLGDRISERLRAAQGVLGLASRYGTPRLETACERALCHDSPHLRTVKTILSTGADLQPITTPDTPAAYANARFTRSAADLFDADGTLH
jgi:hypothetical protein